MIYLYQVKGLEYLGTKLKSGAEAKRFVTLKTSDSCPSKDDVVALAKSNSKVRKVWVMQMNGNKWKKAMDTIDV